MQDFLWGFMEVWTLFTYIQSGTFMVFCICVAIELQWPSLKSNTLDKMGTPSAGTASPSTVVAATDVTCDICHMISASWLKLCQLNAVNVDDADRYQAWSLDSQQCKTSFLLLHMCPSFLETTQWPCASQKYPSETAGTVGNQWMVGTQWGHPSENTRPQKPTPSIATE